MSRPRPFVLCVIDGWGVRDDVTEGNAVALAKTPHMTAWRTSYPYTTIAASGLAVGLPEGQMGNSEVGHLNIGAGFVLYQDSTRITESIRDGSFDHNPELVAACRHARDSGHALHLLGLLGPGGVHAYSDHLYALLRLAKAQGLTNVFVHPFLDGRDTPPQSALPFIDELLKVCSDVGVGKIATISGRYYAMDRDKRWERVEKAYRALVDADGPRATDPRAVIQTAYDAGITDEFVLPTIIIADDKPVATIADGDSVIFFNFRTDRGRELTRAIMVPDFNGFARERMLENLYYVTMTEYEAALPVHVAFPPKNVDAPLARVISDAGLSQFHTAETEKYAHVTFFINGGREEPFPGEVRELISSPKVATYDLQPDMSARPVTEAVLKALSGDEYDVVIMNFANPDMVGHTGLLAATIEAVTVVDECLGRIAEATLAGGGAMLITCDHGNAEQMIDPVTRAPHTAHTVNPVPCVVLLPDGSPRRGARLRSGGKLADVAPTVLDLLDLPQPAAMTGVSLFESGEGRS